MLVGAAAWEDARVIFNGEVLELRNIDSQIRVARTTREPDDLNVPVPVCAPMDPKNRRHRRLRVTRHGLSVTRYSQQRYA